MTTKKNATKPLKPSKKEARKIIAAKLEHALPELRMALGDKLFLARVKKAAKVLGEDFALLPASNEEPVEEASVPKKEKVKKAKKVEAAAPAAPEVKKVKTAKKAKAAKVKSIKKEVAEAGNGSIAAVTE